MKYRYYYCSYCKPELISFLDHNAVKYLIREHGKRSLIIFNIWSTQANAEHCNAELIKMIGRPIVYAEYTEADRRNARFLCLHPTSQKVNIINGKESFVGLCKYTSNLGFDCYKHEKQIDTIAIAKEPSSKKTVFWTEDMGFSVLFTDRRVYETVKKSSLEGVDFLKIKLRSGEFSDAIFQMISHHVLPRECIQIGYGEQIEKCPVCRKEQYFINNAYQLHLNYSKIPFCSDFYMTDSIWGSGIAYPLFIISQNFYQLLKHNGLTGGAKFSPVVEVH